MSLSYHCYLILFGIIGFHFCDAKRIACKRINLNVVVLLSGEEETEIDVEDGVRFTPFNMREELEEGHFDSEGTYIFKKDKVWFVLNVV